MVETARSQLAQREDIPLPPVVQRVIKRILQIGALLIERVHPVAVLFFRLQQAARRPILLKGVHQRIIEREEAFQVGQQVRIEMAGRHGVNHRRQSGKLNIHPRLRVLTG
ncbi:hypothetical protein [Serratia rhizosphaerae]|uniref:hypothetical protein n=1 Tax=Serratia rhizosphaerae TaxID=2597702 RepID=UPI00135A54FC|nr:hypothetical protein [Serratia rhizosphaerae]